MNDRCKLRPCRMVGLCCASLKPIESSAKRTCRPDPAAYGDKGQRSVDAAQYYSEYHGHRVQHLAVVRAALAEAGCAAFIYLAGDSSLDNKHWYGEDDSGRTCCSTQCATLVQVLHVR